MSLKNLSICLSGGTGWLGRSLAAVATSPESQSNLSIYGRNDSQLALATGFTLPIRRFDINEIVDKQFDVFAPFAFLTRDKAISMSDDEYEMANRRIIDDSVKIIRSGNIGSVINLSSGVVSSMSENQKAENSYSIYSRLKEHQEGEFASACEDVGVPLINCRVFSLSGIDMQEPTKYAIGDLVSRALNHHSIELESRSPVTRRYMDSRDLMFYLLEYSRLGKSRQIESGGTKLNLIQLSEDILDVLGLSKENISFKSEIDLASNHYHSRRNDFEDFSTNSSRKMLGIESQIQNVLQALNLKQQS